MNYHDLTNEQYFDLEEIYKSFGSVPRLRILIRLSQGNCNVGELSVVAGLSQSATSHQLKELKLKKIIDSRKDGVNIIYSLNDNHIFKMLQSGIEHIKGENCHE